MAHREFQLCVFVDALGWEALQSRPFLEKVAPYRRSTASVLGYSAACLPSILTGLMPQEHGHFSFFRYDPGRSPFRAMAPLARLPRTVTSRGRIRRKLSQLTAKLKGFTGYFQLYGMPFEALPFMDYTERKDIYAPEGINGGQPTFLDALRRKGRPFFLSDWRRSEAQNIGAFKAHLEAGHRPELAWIYLPELDGLLHRVGTQSPAIDQHLKELEHAIEGLVEASQRAFGDDVRLHVFSDHGMADVKLHLPLKPRVESLGLTSLFPLALR